MYRTCIFCSADLGSNESIEEFPVGKGLAFDAARGRLWAVCPRCARWNLAPIEERWEAVEEAEKRFRDARLRAQSENVGLARLADGTRLIRVGEALPGELAAWRYGDQLVRRRRRYLVAVGLVGAAAVAYGGLALAGVLGGGAGAINIANLAWQHRRARRPVHRLGAEESPTGQPLLLRRYQLNGARATTADDGEIALHLPQALEPARVRGDDGRAAWLPARSLVLTGPAARSVLGRAMVDANAGGASRRHLGGALELLSGPGGAEAYLRRAAGGDRPLGLPHVQSLQVAMGWNRFVGVLRGEAVPAAPERPVAWGRTWSSMRARADRLSRPESLALEMALHEETERRALEGELAALEAAWREAEEIAAIADALPDDPLGRLRGRPGGSASRVEG
ncbi:MAG TPA: hypothetical protein VF615_06840 [Longimicrobiaceae bacterium]